MTARQDTEERVRTDDDSPVPPRRRRLARVAAVVSVFGELLITAGLILGLFVVYSLWWTNVLANREAAKQADHVRDRWAQQDRAPEDSSPAREYQAKDGMGFLHIPAMGEDSEILIVKGTEPKKLNRGVAGYYTKPRKAAMPWEKKGNFALAAHRDGHGAKFHNLDKVGKGDVIVVETKDDWFVYRVFNTLPQTSKYNVGVIEPIPKGSGKKKPGRYITLTTCTPVFTSKYRLVVWGELVRTEKVDAKRTLPKELR